VQRERICPANGAAEHMGTLLEIARKQTLHNYRAILQDIHEKPSIIAQTYKNPPDGRPVVSLRPLYLCLQCPSIMTEGDRDEHIDVKRHIFCGLFCVHRDDVS
jgi:ubiquitin carboxyl-terminal hydrolase 22/27/51